MIPNSNSFSGRYRHEYKYRIDARQESLLRLKAGMLMQPDSHAGADGGYLIRSAYFDDPFDTCLWENQAGVDPRSKFRIRYYNADLSHISLEKKSKTRMMCYKESCSLTPDEAERMLAGQIIAPSADMPQAKQALLAQLQLRDLKPHTIITYYRIPFVHPAGNVRVTFDKDITSSAQLDSFLSGDYAQRPVLPVGESILEVKWDEVLPLYIKQGLQIDGLQWSAFSKYFMGRCFHL